MKILREFIGRYEHMGGTTWTVEHQWAIEGEAEEIVRCRDCRFCGKGNWGVEAFPVCRRGIHAFQVSNDGFCKWGKRRGA